MPEEITDIASDSVPVSKTQEQMIYGSFLVITGTDLQDILVPLNCKTAGLTSLADLLNVKKLFPNSYQTLTVPVYNTTPSPNNSKTYYPIYEGNSVSSRITSPAVSAKVGTTILPGDPPIVEPTTSISTTKTASVNDSAARTFNRAV
jgi:hypothetical protein